MKHVHIVGVCGTLMGAFAAYLKRAGVRVTGSDQNIYPPMSDVLKAAQVELFSGYSDKNLDLLGSTPDLVVIGNVITAKNPEAAAVIERKWKYTSLPEAMENLFLVHCHNIVVAGTHGKTTTSSLLASTLTGCANHVSYFMGGVAHDLPHSFHVDDLVMKSKPSGGKRPYFVLEGDEYDTAFWDKVPKFFHYRPTDAILTSVEYDHADIYPNLEAVVKAFYGLAERMDPSGTLIACVDYPEVKKVISKAKCRVITYGNAGEFGVANLQEVGGNQKFSVTQNGKPIDELLIQLPGHHNALNALAAYLECKNLGLDLSRVKERFAKFRGVKRRQEERGEVRGALVIDDFAHHPTAVRETLKALKRKYPGRRLLAIFEPRSATSRRKVFQDDYVSAFDEADLVWIAKPYDQSKISTDDQFSSEQLASAMDQRSKDGGSRSWVFEEVDQGVNLVADALKPHDVVAVLSNGGFGGFISKLLAK